MGTWRPRAITVARPGFSDRRSAGSPARSKSIDIILDAWCSSLGSCGHQVGRSPGHVQLEVVDEGDQERCVYDCACDSRSLVSARAASEVEATSKASSGRWRAWAVKAVEKRAKAAHALPKVCE